jgi:hypothetical protein
MNLDAGWTRFKAKLSSAPSFAYNHEAFLRYSVSQRAFWAAWDSGDGALRNVVGPVRCDVATKRMHVQDLHPPV